MADKIEVENINQPGHVGRVQRDKYEAMRKAMLASLPKGAPGITIAEAKAGILPKLPDDLFPGGATAGWWIKCVQLDLEAKGLIARADSKPLRLFKMA